MTAWQKGEIEIESGEKVFVKCFSHDTELMKFVGALFLAGDPLFGILDR